MRRRTCLAVAGTVALACSGRAADLYFEDFEADDGPAEGWLVTSGIAEIRSNEYLLESPDGASEIWTWIDTADFEGDIALEFDILFDPADSLPEVGRHGGVMFFANEKTARYSPTMTGYIMDWIDRTAAPNDYGYRFHKWNGGNETPMVPDGSVPDPDIGGHWRITTSGSTIVFEADGEVKAIAEDEEYRLGSIGFWGYANQQHIHVDNVRVSLPPSAKLTANPTSGPQELEVTFNASGSSSPEGTITAYEWDFGDGSTASGVQATHTYKDPGLFKARLGITDSRGLRAFATVDISVSFKPGDVSPWISKDVGTVVLPGGARPEGNCISVFASGKEIALAEDHFHFVCQAKSGDTVLTTNVGGVVEFPTGARGGVMLRNSADPNSAFVMMAVNPTAAGLRTVFLSRKATDGRVTVKSAPSLTLTAGAAYLRVERSGLDFIGSASPDGTTWTEITRVVLDAPADTLLAGLALTATDKLETGVFANLVFCDTSFGASDPTPVFHRGDADDNGSLQLTDALKILSYLYLGQAEPTCFDAADADDNGQLQLTDALRVLGFLFLGQTPPAPPGPPGEACGLDPTTDDPLGCSNYSSC